MWRDLVLVVLTVLRGAELFEPPFETLESIEQLQHPPAEFADRLVEVVRAFVRECLGLFDLLNPRFIHGWLPA